MISMSISIVISSINMSISSINIVSSISIGISISVCIRFVIIKANMMLSLRNAAGNLAGWGRLGSLPTCSIWGVDYKFTNYVQKQKIQTWISNKPLNIAPLAIFVFV